MIQENQIKSILDKYSATISEVQVRFTDENGYNRDNTYFMRWYVDNYKGKFKMRFSVMRRLFKGLTIESQVVCLCNLFMIKPLIHELCIHTNSELLESYGAIESKKLQMTNGGAIMYGDWFPFDVVLKLWQEDGLLRSRRQPDRICYGKYDIIFELMGYCRERIREIMCRAVIGNIPSLLDPFLQRRPDEDVEMYLKTSDISYMVTENMMSPFVSGMVLNCKNGVTFSPCTFTQGPFYKFETGDRLPTNVLKDLGINFFDVPIEKRQRIIKEVFDVEFGLYSR